MAFSGLANESARLTYTTPRWIFQRRTPGLSRCHATEEVTLAGVAVVSSLRALIIQTYRVPSISVLHRGRMWAAWRCRRLGIPRHALFTVSYWNCTRGTHRCFARSRAREEMETHFISRLGDSPSKPRHVTDGLVSTYKSTWRFSPVATEKPRRERTNTEFDSYNVCGGYKSP